jgi:hypothetical protein
LIRACRCPHRTPPHTTAHHIYTANEYKKWGNNKEQERTRKRVCVLRAHVFMRTDVLIWGLENMYCRENYFAGMWCCNFCSKMFFHSHHSTLFL